MHPYRLAALATLSALVLAGSTPSADAQILSREKVTAHYQLPASLPPGVEAFFERRRLDPGETGTAFLFTSTLPVSFSRLERGDGGEWNVGANMTLGASALFMIANARGLEGGDVEFEPQFYAGPVANVGVTQDLEEGGIEPSLMIGGVLGFTQIAALVGYDFLTSSPVLGIGSQITLQSITGDMAKILWLVEDQ